MLNKQGNFQAIISDGERVQSKQGSQQPDPDHCGLCAGGDGGGSSGGLPYWQAVQRQ